MAFFACGTRDKVHPRIPEPGPAGSPFFWPLLGETKATVAGVALAARVELSASIDDNGAYCPRINSMNVRYLGPMAAAEF